MNPMNCELARELLEPLVDGELDPNRQADLREHFRECPACASRRQELLDQSAAIRRQAIYYRAPAGLSAKIRQSLSPAESPWRWTVSGNVWRWSAAAATVLLVLSLAGNIVLLRSRQSPTQLLADTIVASHVRSLIGTHLVDVPSSDQHTVKPWFNGKLDFAPDVRDFAAQGFVLVGGRIEYLENRRVAALVYQRRQHTINVFIWPSDLTLAAEPAIKNGYNLIHWSRAGAVWWIVSDLNLAELTELSRLLGG